MKTNTLGATPALSSVPACWPELGTLRVLCVYEGLSSGVAVREALEWLSRQGDPYFRISHKVWSFTDLARLDAHAAALWDAAEADILIVAADGTRNLPDPVRIWLERCFAPGDRCIAALVALHDDGEGANHPLTDELRALAESWGLQMITNADFEDRLSGGHLNPVLRVQGDDGECGQEKVPEGSTRETRASQPREVAMI